MLPQVLSFTVDFFKSHAPLFLFWYKSVFFYLKKRRRRKKKRIDKISIYCCRCCFPFPRPKFLGSTHALRLLRQNDGRKTYCHRIFVTMVKNTTQCAYQKLGINRVLVCFNPAGEMASKSTYVSNLSKINMLKLGHLLPQ